MAPDKALAWRIESQREDLSGLTLSKVPLKASLGENDVLVELRAASLNHRDLVLVTGSGLTSAPNVVPGSDGAGIVLATGSSVEDCNFKPGDHVLTYIIPGRPRNTELGPVPEDMRTDFRYVCAGLGHELDGTLATHAVFDRHNLVKYSGKMSFADAATLSCSGLTAYNVLFGGRGERLGKQDTLLVQGTGGVSVAALQFAKAIGSKVIAITSSEEKAARLKSLGADHVINYRDTPEWGEVAKRLTWKGLGVDMVVDVGGNSTLEQSIQAVRVEGVVSIVGVAGNSETVVPMMRAFEAPCVVRGVCYGTRLMLGALVEFVEGNGIKPALDEERFSLKDVKAAFKKMEEQQHFSKVIIQIPE